MSKTPGHLRCWEPVPEATCAEAAQVAAERQLARLRPPARWTLSTVLTEQQAESQEAGGVLGHPGGVVACAPPRGVLLAA